MRLLIKRGRIIDPHSPYNGKRLDIFIRDGIIRKIGRGLKDTADQIVEARNLHVSPGWMDIGTQICEPGFEHREDINSISEAAMNGGYTAIACFPNTNPPLHSKSQIEYVLNRGRNLPIDIYPIGALSHDCAGTEMAEILDMHNAGAIAFSDGRESVNDAGLLLRALQYSKTCNAVVINKPEDRRVSRSGQMHESSVSTSLGLAGVPSIAEHIMLQRDVQLLRYSGSRLHVYGVSTAEGVGLIRSAKKSGLNISASVAAMNLLYTDEDLRGFDPNLKVKPPLRGSGDCTALIRGLRDGTIDTICSNHEPVEADLKEVEFAHSEFGASTIETAFTMACTALSGKLEIADLIEKFVYGSRGVLGLSISPIELKRSAQLTLFDPDVVLKADQFAQKSKSANIPELPDNAQGKVVGVVIGEEVHLTEIN